MRFQPRDSFLFPGVHIQQRWVFAIMGLLAILNAYTMRSCLSIAITAMVVSGTNESTSTDGTCTSNQTTTTSSSTRSGTYEWDEYTQGIILSSFYWGYVITHLPGGMLADKFGGKYILGLGILSTAIFTLFTPIVVDAGGSTGLIVLRVLMGLGEGMTLPAMSSMMGQWTPPHEKSKIGSMVQAGAVIGSIFASSVSGFLISYSPLGWPIVFYFFGSVGVLWFVFWVVLCYSSPDDHPFMSDKERKLLHDAMAAHTHKRAPMVPWRHIIRSAPVWAVVCATAGHDWCFYTLTTDLPKYMSNVLKFSIDANGLLSALPYLCTWLCCIVTSWVADWLIMSGYMVTGNVRKVGSTIASIGSVFVIAASYSGCDRVVAVVFFVVAMTLIGAQIPAVRINGLDLSPNYAGSLMSMTNGMGAITGIATPYLVGVLTPNQTLSEWRIVFWIVLVVQMSTNVIFVIWGSGEVQYWNNPEFLDREKEERRREAEEHALKRDRSEFVKY